MQILWYTKKMIRGKMSQKYLENIEIVNSPRPKGKDFAYDK